MKKLILILIISLSFFSVFTQTQTIYKWPNGYAPIIDGIDDAIWQYADLNLDTHIFDPGIPTLCRGTGWKGAWNDTALFFIVYVNDDHYCDRWCSGIDSLFDRVEIYLDVNDTLHDGIGAKTMFDGKGTGHYRFAPGTDSSFETAVTSGIHMNSKVGQWVYNYAYNITDPNYIFEYAIRINKEGGLIKKNGSLLMYADSILFECTINDYDPGDTLFRRINWHTPTGSKISAWDNMDVAGKVSLSTVETGVYPLKTNEIDVNDNCSIRNISNSTVKNILIFPNPAASRINIFGISEINRISILDILGRILKTLPNNKAESMEIDVSSLSTGVYLIKMTDLKGNILTKRFLKK
jgi:hypothetical protein